MFHKHYRLQLLVSHREHEPCPPLIRQIAGPARQPKFGLAQVRNVNGAKIKCILYYKLNFLSRLSRYCYQSFKFIFISTKLQKQECGKNC